TPLVARRKIERPQLVELHEGIERVLPVALLVGQRRKCASQQPAVRLDQASPGDDLANSPPARHVPHDTVFSRCSRWSSSFDRARPIIHRWQNRDSFWWTTIRRWPWCCAAG